MAVKNKKEAKSILLMRFFDFTESKKKPNNRHSVKYTKDINVIELTPSIIFIR